MSSKLAEVISQALILAGSSLWAPALWALTMEFNQHHEWHDSFVSFHTYGLYGLLITWLGALPLSISTWLLMRRTTPWILAPCLSWLLLVVLIFVFLVGSTAPGGGGIAGFRGVSKDQLRDTILLISLLLTVSSIPIWLCVRSRRLSRIFRSFHQENHGTNRESAIRNNRQDQGNV